jgi:TPR repeat protein
MSGTIDKGLTIDELYKIGRDYHKGENGKPEDIDIAVKYYEAAAEKGSLPVMYKLSEIYNIWIDDIEKATHGYREAAKTGDSVAMLDCANWLFNEYTGLPEDKTEACQWLEKAAAAGETDAMWKMAVFHEYGLSGFQQSIDKAKYWYKQALDNGDETARVYVKVLEM